MKLGILKTDAVRPEWVPDFGEYPDMFVRLLSAVDPDIDFSVWDVEAGQTPTDLEAMDGWLITGSKSAAYEDKPWIRDLEDVVRRLHAARRKVIGICFGHQLIAQALGGRVEKSDKGWGVGIHRYQLTPVGESLLPGHAELQLLVSHQDQVVTPPPGAEVLATSAFCEFAALRLNDHVLTFQGHPEFVPDYSRAIMSFREPQIGAERVQAGLASLQEARHEGDRVARSIVDFLQR